MRLTVRNAPIATQLISMLVLIVLGGLASGTGIWIWSDGTNPRSDGLAVNEHLRSNAAVLEKPMRGTTFPPHRPLHSVMLTNWLSGKCLNTELEQVLHQQGATVMLMAGQPEESCPCADPLATGSRAGVEIRRCVMKDLASIPFMI